MIVSEKILTVAEMTNLIRRELESNYANVMVQGEVSNFKHHTSGHMYFTLKDASAQISCVLWKSRVSVLTTLPEEGIQVVVRGSITVYPPRGSYQIDVEHVAPLGLGELQQAFERLKRRLAAEGLFDAEKKKPIPEFPECIGIITSQAGAALQDILSVLARRFPSVIVLLVPVRVQGVGAAREIAEAIADCNRYGRLDVLIVTRGGGSLEDLWAFNEEVVARAIHASNIPIISAVGHEIDFSIADFVADLRAPTPSAAAELATPDQAQLLDLLRNLYYTMHQSLDDRVQRLRDRISNLVASYSFNRPKNDLRQYTQRLDELDRALAVSFSHLHERIAAKQHGLDQRLRALHPDVVLKRGYAIIRKGSRVVASVHQVNQGDQLVAQFHDGHVSTLAMNYERSKSK
jgi:exodeoxyribonuclease VII large subunit